MWKGTAAASISLDSPVADFPSVHDKRKLDRRLSSRGMEGKYERFLSVNEKNPHFSKDACGSFPCIRSLSVISALVCFLIGTHLNLYPREIDVPLHHYRPAS